MYLPTLKLNVTAKVQVTPGSPFQSICLDLVDLSCDMESTMFDKRSVYPKRKGIPNRIASVKFSSDEFWNARHFCNDAYVEGELDVIASKFDFEALRDSLWAAKDVLLHKKESVSLNANLRCFVTSDVYLFGIFLRRHTNEKPIEQSTVLATSAAENSHEENDVPAGQRRRHQRQGFRGAAAERSLDGARAHDHHARADPATRRRPGGPASHLPAPPALPRARAPHNDDAPPCGQRTPQHGLRCS